MPISDELDAAIATFAVEEEGELYDAITRQEIAMQLCDYLMANGWTIEKAGER